MTLRHCLKKSAVYLFQTCLDITSYLYGDVLQEEKGFSSGSAGKESAHNAGDLGSIPGFERSPGEGKGYPLQYPGLENSMDCTKSQT